jgi:hypothetical protein
MNLNVAAGKPCASAFDELGRFGNFGHTEKIAIEAAGGIFGGRRDRELDMIESQEWNVKHG